MQAVAGAHAGELVGLVERRVERGRVRQVGVDLDHRHPVAVLPGGQGRRHRRPEQVGPVMGDYLGPSLDTTILATGSMIALFAQHPDQWDKLRASPSQIPNAINEAMRLEGPAQGFTRVLTDDFSVENQRLNKGDRVLILFASANRDERHWEDPERFDITRRAAEQVGFGHGIHMCMGANLARLEMSAILSALIPRVERFELHDAERILNNVLRGYKSLKLTAHAVK